MGGSWSQGPLEELFHFIIQLAGVAHDMNACAQ